MIRKRFFGPAQLQTSPSIVYVCSTLTTSMILRIEVMNPTGSPQTFTLSIDGDTASERIYDAVTVAAGGRFSKRIKYDLSPGETVRASASSTSVVMTLSGQESAASVFPLHVHSSGRYLVDSSSRPFALRTEFGWNLATQSTREQVITYLNNRWARGINGFEVMLIQVESSSPYIFHRQNAYGEEPFSTIGDFSTPNDAYWDHVEFLIDEAARRGIVVEGYHSYAGFAGGSDQGWWTVIASNTLSACQTYGTYLGNRFGKKPNLIWMNGGDYSPPTGTTLDKHRAILTSIRDAGGYGLSGSEWGFPDTLVTEVDSGGGTGGYTFGIDPTTSDMQLDTFYAQGPSQNGRTYTTADESWSRSSPVLPSIATETMQYLGTYAPIDSSRPAIRKYVQWAITAGSIAGCNAGFFAASGQDFFDNLDLVWADDYALMIRFYNTVPWWKMRPSGTASDHAGRDLIVSGGGTGDSKITSCMASDGSCLLAYVPPTGTGTTTFSVDFRSMAANGTVEWWNPITGALSSDGTFLTSDSAKSLTTPSAAGRSDSSNDWLLVCRS